MPSNAMRSLGEMFRQFRTAEGQSRPAKTVERYGWLLLIQGSAVLLFPHFIASILGFAPLEHQAAGFLRLVGMLIGGFGMVYAISGRMNAEGFVFASLIDRPFVAPVTAVLWYLGMLPGGLALLIAFEDSATWLWTFLAWRAATRNPE
ncbi:MAG: hypothetical protein V4819_07990 [Verrucomicrobiota bacterium]